MPLLSLNPVPILETQDSGLLLFRDNVQLNYNKIQDIVNKLDGSNIKDGSLSGAEMSNGEIILPPARLGPSPAGAYGSVYASLDHTGRAYTAAGAYIVLADTLQTYLNAPTGGNIFLRINNIDSMTVKYDRSLRGSYAPGTITEAVGDGNLSFTGTSNPNFIIQAGSLVGNFVGGNCAFTYGNAFPGGINSLVCCEGGGNAGWIAGNQNVTRLGFGVYLKSDAGALAGGLFRINYIAMGF